MICEILGVFRNTLTANDKYPVWDCENLWFPIQMELSSNPKPFSYFFFCYSQNLHQIWKSYKKKLIVIATLLRNFQAVKDLVKLLSEEHCFRTSFESQHVRVSQTLVKSV